jgi:hypothetical protein
MSRHYTVRPKHALYLQAPVATIEPVGTEVTVAGQSIETAVVTSDEIFDADGAGFLQVTSTSSAAVLVTYVGEASDTPRAPRGSSTSGETGGFESRTDKELRKEAAAKNIKGRSKMDKDELIAALRAAE